MERRRLTSGTVWERKAGFARLVQAGPFVAIAGTVAAEEDGKPASPTAAGQANFIFKKFADLLGRVGGDLGSVVRLRLYYVDAGVEAGFLEALEEAFPGGAPALTTVRVAHLVSPEFHLELEADAFLDLPGVEEQRPRRRRDDDEPEASD